jgi:hypothetical protein
MGRLAAGHDTNTVQWVQAARHGAESASGLGSSSGAGSADAESFGLPQARRAGSRPELVLVATLYCPRPNSGDVARPFHCDVGPVLITPWKRRSGDVVATHTAASFPRAAAFRWSAIRTTNTASQSRKMAGRSRWSRRAQTASEPRAAGSRWAAGTGRLSANGRFSAAASRIATSSVSFPSSNSLRFDRRSWQQPPLFVAPTRSSPPSFGL